MWVLEGNFFAKEGCGPQKAVLAITIVLTVMLSVLSCTKVTTRARARPLASTGHCARPLASTGHRARPLASTSASVCPLAFV